MGCISELPDMLSLVHQEIQGEHAFKKRTKFLHGAPLETNGWA